jgi:hypothetical protein
MEDPHPNTDIPPIDGWLINQVCPSLRHVEDEL